jgi:large subunit ribosomal protein L21
MTTVVEISGKQYSVQNGDIVKTPKLNGEVGESIELGSVLLSEDEGNVTVGSPTLDLKVKAEILEHGRDKKVLVFHKKRRKGYQKMNGHRDHFTKIKITAIEN